MGVDRKEFFRPVKPSSIQTSKQPASSHDRSIADGWQVIAPVPSDVQLLVPREHPTRGCPSSVWSYRDEVGRLLGFVWRFDTSSGGKEFVYVTFCKHQQTGKCAWRFKAWKTPRPLYGLDRLDQMPSATVIVSEGEKAADAVEKLLPDMVCVTSPGGCKAAGHADWSKLAGRDIVIWPDHDNPGQEYAAQVCGELKAVDCGSIRIVAPPSDARTGWDAADALVDGWTRKQIKQLIAAAVPAEVRFDASSYSNDRVVRTRGGGRSSQRDLVLQLLDDVEFWHDDRKEAFASYPVGDHVEHSRIRDRMFNLFVTGRYFDETGGAVSKPTLDDCLRVCEAKAIFNGSCHPVFLRVGELDGDIYVDLANDNWQAVRIHAHGYDVVDQPQLKFLRPQTLRSLPEPEAGCDVNYLRSFLNVADEADFKLAIGWMLGAFRPKGPYPLLSVSGEQGSGKSSFTDALVGLIDPGVGKRRAFPKDERDLMISAKHSHVQQFDNLSWIPGDISDVLSRLSTGGGFVTRKLHTDADLTVLSVSSPVILNGIPELVGRPDLANRAISIQLRRLKAEERKTEEELADEFDEVKPKVLGALFDGLSAGLRNLEKVQLDQLPRMADFARWVEACASGLGWRSGEFLSAYEQNQLDVNESVLETEPVAIAIQKFIRQQSNGWEGTATRLLQELNDTVSEFERNSRRWPKNANALGVAVNRVSPLLRDRGVSIERTHSGDRSIQLKMLPASE